MATYYLNVPDAAFLNLANAVYNTAEANMTGWGIPAGELEKILPKLNDFIAALSKLNAPGGHTPENTQAKNDARHALTPVLSKFIQRYIYMNDAVTRADLLHIGLPLHDTTSTVHPAPVSQLMLEVMIVNSRHTVTAIDMVSKSSRRPADAYGCKFACKVCKVGEPAPTNPNDFGNTVFTRKTSAVYDHPEVEEGSVAYYAGRYENAKGEAGPWSKIARVIIS